MIFHKVSLYKRYQVYEYHFLDDLRAVVDPEEIYNNQFLTYKNTPSLSEIISAVSDLFDEHGWEGDGDIGLIWLPPFVDAGIEDTHGNYLWHVKQNNNGTSWIASPFHLPFERILAQNKKFNEEDLLTVSEKVNIVESEVKSARSHFTQIKEKYDSQLSGLSKLEDPTPFHSTVLEFTQNKVIAQLSTFIDDCYLRILIEVLSHGNTSKLKLKNISTKLDLDAHTDFDSDDDEELTQDGSHWLSVQTFIGDIWRGFKFEPFTEKFRRLNQAIELKIDDEPRRILIKHVIIRNTFQHHEGIVEPSSLKSLGNDKIEIAGDPVKNIHAFHPIELTEPELTILFENVLAYVEAIDIQVTDRIKARDTVTRKLTKEEIQAIMDGL